MSSPEKIARLQKALQQREEQMIAAKAVRDKILKDLKDKWGLKDIKSAKKKLKEMKANYETMQKDLKEKYDGFIKQYGEQLGLG